MPAESALGRIMKPSYYWAARAKGHSRRNFGWLGTWGLQRPPWGCTRPRAPFKRRNFSVTVQLQAAAVVKVPTMAESISEGTLSAMLKKVGDFVEVDEEIATIETDKIDVSVLAPEAGILQEIFVNEGSTVTVGEQIARIEIDLERPLSKEDTSARPGDVLGISKALTGEIVAPELTKPSHQPIDPIEEPKLATSTPTPRKLTNVEPELNPAGSTAAPFMPGDRGKRSVKMSRMRMTIADRLKQSQNTAASLTTFNEVDVSALVKLRRKYKDEILESHGVKIGFMGAFTKAATLALKAFPQVNASIETDEQGDAMVTYRDYVDISVAVSTPKGLVTPVVRNCERLSVVEIERAIANYTQKARNGRITMDDLAGGNFTISNGGVFGSMMGTPIINLPQTAVLGVNAIKERPVAIDGKVEIRPMMYLALTYDHRLIDGRESVGFLVKLRDYLEDPVRMLLE
ncbi:putative dihydrolipoyllysine-residue succinyltransferase component of 2-oxoglutarate dehydrogenase complex, mitochondrial [Fonsecaea pedrosoi]|nr:putative dihydrolipoyllysine-residue succinyltransferase component of 2-oxoglutarate dehydrogenase complex, mitochondrial [Fonsecaea pedrosoi]